jgi:hypothetical protein
MMMASWTPTELADEDDGRQDEHPEGQDRDQDGPAGHNTRLGMTWPVMACSVAGNVHDHGDTSSNTWARFRADNSAQVPFKRGSN